MNKLSVVLVGTVVALILGSCTSSPGSPQDTPSSAAVQPSSSPSPSDSSGDGLDDLKAIDDAVRLIHRDAFAVVSEATWTERVDQLRTELPGLSPDERIVAMAGLAGLLDTHTQYFSEADERIFNAWLYRFPEGLYVVAADDQSLVGTRLVAVNETPIATIERKVRDLIPADNSERAAEQRLGPRLSRLPARPGSHRQRGQRRLHGGGTRRRVAVRSPSRAPTSAASSRRTTCSVRWGAIRPRRCVDAVRRCGAASTSATRPSCWP